MKQSLPVKDFTKFKSAIEADNLNAIQISSYEQFLETGLQELFDELSPIEDHTGDELAVYFKSYSFGDPKVDQTTARHKDATYEAPLHVEVTLEDKKTGKSKTQELYLGDFPLMTDRGTFLINGVERVVVSQLIRSSGAYFTAKAGTRRKRFGAKVIPGRGSWLEFGTDARGQIWVKIDRNRKAPVTDLLRVFRINEKEMRNTLKSVDTGELSYLEQTLSKDAAENVDEAYLELYKRIRPGDPVTPDAAKSLIDSMLFSADRYDLSEVGRFKLNQRLGLKSKSRLLTKDDVLGVVKEIIRLNNDPEAKTDDIDHLGNRRVRAVGELLQVRLRIGLARMRRIVQDRMSTLDREELLPAQLINFRPLTAVVREFFSSSQLSQFMDQENPLAELEHKRRLSALGPGGLTRERASFEVRDVHRSHYGRICPIETPEGANVGLLNHLANFARINDLGFLETPYAKVEDGVITDKVEWLDAIFEEQQTIVHAASPRDKNGKLKGPTLDARIEGEPGTCTPDEVDYIEIAPHQFVSVASALVPFLQHDDANRALMGSNMQRQAVPSIRPDAPYVGTGMEERVALDSGYVIRADGPGEVVSVDATHITIKYNKGGKKTYSLESFKRSNQSTAISQKPVVNRGDKVKKGTVLTTGSSIDQGVLALGQNLRVAFMSWEGANFEDAIILSERVAREDRFTSIHVENFECDVRDTKLGPEITTPDIPNVSEDRLANLDEEGVIRVGAEVRTGDILVGKISPRGEAELTAEEKLLRAIFGEKARDVKDSSLRLPHGKRGRVVGIRIFSREEGDKLDPGIIKKIQIEVASLRKIQVGDKLAGRHGNKGVISQVRPVEDMPHLEDGTPIDIILNPLGVASRMNIGQILETHLGWAAEKLGYRAVTPSFDSASEEDIRKELKKAGLPEDGKAILYDGRTGQKFDDPVAVGQMYILKLDHLVEDKVHMRSIGPYSLITQQPLGGKAQFGGQRFGEMEVWALEGYGARHTLQEMLTIKSDDVLGRSSAYNSIVRNEEIREPNVPESFNVLINELKSLVFNVDPQYKAGEEPRYDPEDRIAKGFNSLQIKVASPDEVLSWSHGEVIKPETINYRTQRPEKDGLFSERIFGPTKDFECYCGKYRKVRYKGVVCDKCGVEVTRSAVRRERLGHIELAAPVCHIWFFKSIPSPLSVILDISASKLEKVIYYVDYIVTEVNEDERKVMIAQLEDELKVKLKETEDDKQEKLLLSEANKLKKLLNSLKAGYVLNENEYFTLSRKFGNVFHANTGAEAIRSILRDMDLAAEVKQVRARIEESSRKTEQKKLLRRLKMLSSMHKNGIKPEWLVLKVLPVLPPELRPMVPLDGGRYATSDLNDLYRRVLNRNNRLKKLMEIQAPEIIIRNEKRMLQEAVDALIDNSARFGPQHLSSNRRPLRSLADMLKGKQGRFRRNLLGKRVDYSGRSVIVVGPSLEIDEVGLPKKMALELFRPFVIGEMLERGIVHNLKSASRLIEQETDEVWAILEDVIQGKRVLLNRAPTLHRLSVQAFKPLLVEGLAIQIPPLVCAAFNADFDGDQMAVHLPLSRKAQWEAEEIMAAGKNLLKPATGDIIAGLSQDSVLGVYYLTREDPSFSYDLEEIRKKEQPIKTFRGLDEALQAYVSDTVTLHEPVYTSHGITTVGRLMLNDLLDDAVPYVNETLTKKKISKLTEKVFEKHGVDVARSALDKLKFIGFEMASKSGITWAMADLLAPEAKQGLVGEAENQVEEIRSQFTQGLLTNAERSARVIRIWEDVKEKVDKAVVENMPATNSIYQIIESGARGSWTQPSQMMGMRGLVSNPNNEIIELPIKGSFKEGLSVLEYFISTHGARKGTTDTALKTAQAGYLTRRLADVAQDVLVVEKDCGTTRGIVIEKKEKEDVGREFEFRIFSRMAVEDIKAGRKKLASKGDIIDKSTAKEIATSEKVEAVKVRSPLTCNSLYGVCARCYGYDLGNNRPIEEGAAVGVVAAQSIGEPGTQLTMRTFHTGGVAGLDITHGLPRIEELFEARSPKGKAVLSEVEGEVEDVEEKGSKKTIRITVTGDDRRSKRKRGAKGKKKKPAEYTVPASAMLYVNVGDKVEVGQQISEGHLDLDELMKYRGMDDVMQYIIEEVQKIYGAEGSPVHDKHIELIVQKMFSRVKITNPGDAADFVVGEVLEKSQLAEINKQLKADGKDPAKADQLLLGITRVALTTDSFLSAASFQDTARVLVKAAIEGRVDNLRGLKENVIIGRLVPAGPSSLPEEVELPESAVEEEPVGVADEPIIPKEADEDELEDLEDESEEDEAKEEE